MVFRPFLVLAVCASLITGAFCSEAPRNALRGLSVPDITIPATSTLVRAALCLRLQAPLCRLRPSRQPRSPRHCRPLPAPRAAPLRRGVCGLRHTRSHGYREPAQRVVAPPPSPPHCPAAAARACVLYFVIISFDALAKSCAAMRCDGTESWIRPPSAVVPCPHVSGLPFRVAQVRRSGRMMDGDVSGSLRIDWVGSMFEIKISNVASISVVVAEITRNKYVTTIDGVWCVRPVPRSFACVAGHCPSLSTVLSCACVCVCLCVQPRALSVCVPRVYALYDHPSPRSGTGKPSPPAPRAST